MSGHWESSLVWERAPRCVKCWCFLWVRSWEGGLLSTRDVDCFSCLMSGILSLAFSHVCYYRSFIKSSLSGWLINGLWPWLKGFLHGSAVKNLPANAGEGGSIPGLGRSPGGGNGNPLHLQYSGLENLMDRGAWRATVHGLQKSWTWLNN